MVDTELVEQVDVLDESIVEPEVIDVLSGTLAVLGDEDEFDQNDCL